MAQPYRAFLAHRKDATDWPLGRLALERLLRHGLPDRGVEVKDGYEDWHERFKFCGGWDSWAIDVAAGTIYGSGEPRYHAILAPDRDGLGRATEQIIRVALAKNKPVLWYDAPDFATLDVASFTGTLEQRREAAVRHAPLEALGTLARVRDIERVSDNYKSSANLHF